MYMNKGVLKGLQTTKLDLDFSKPTRKLHIQGVLLENCFYDLLKWHINLILQVLIELMK